MKISLKYQSRVLFVVIQLMTGIVVAKTVDVTDSVEILNRYTQDSGSQITVKMTTEKKSIGIKNTAEGVVSIVPGKINISLNGEKKSEMIFDGNKAYFISYPDVDLDPNGKRKVVQIKSKGKNHLNLISLLFSNPKKFFTTFKVTKKNLDQNEYALTLEDKKKELKPMVLEFSKKNSVVKKISYADDVDTETVIELEKPKFPKNISKNLFKYTKKKNDEEVTE